jgi:hypothetical protein
MTGVWTVVEHWPKRREKGCRGYIKESLVSQGSTGAKAGGSRGVTKELPGYNVESSQRREAR